MAEENDPINDFLKSPKAQGNQVDMPMGEGGELSATPDPLEIMSDLPKAPSLDELYASPSLPPTTPPDSAIRNQSALLSMLSSDPAKATETYQLLMSERQQGNTAIADQLESIVKENTNKLDMRGVLSILGDKNIPLSQKQGAIDAIKQSQFLSDMNTVLYSNALSQGSAGESIEVETSRINTSDLIRQVYQSRKDTQALVNAHVAGLTDSVPSLAVDITTLNFVPFATSISSGRTANQFRENTGDTKSFWGKVFSYLAPGSAVADMRERLSNIPPEKRVEFSQDLLSAIKSSSGVIFTEDNDFAQFKLATQVFEEGGYSDVDKFIDNVVPLLDLVAVGQLAKSGKTAIGSSLKAKTPKVDIPAPAATPAPVAASVEVSQTGTATVSRTPVATIEQRPVDTDARRAKAITALEAQKAEMLGMAGNVAEPGAIRQMTNEIKSLEAKRLPSDKATVDAQAKTLQTKEKLKYKEAVKQVNKNIAESNADIDASIARLQNQIDANRDAENVRKSIQSTEQAIFELTKGMGETPGALDPIADLISRIQINSVVAIENPASVAKVVQQANPEQARNIHQAVSTSAGDEVAEGLYGTTKQDALVSDVMPQVGTDSGKVVTKVNDIERNLREEMDVDQRILDSLQQSGATWFSVREKEAAMAVIRNDFTAAEGLTINDAMTSFRIDGGQVVVSAAYGLPEGSFLRAEDAFSQAKLALRNQGVLDSEIVILSKEGLDHVPVKLDDVRGIEGNYMVRVDTRVDISANQIPDLEKLDVKKNLFDRFSKLVSQNAGSVSRWLLDSASMLSPRITGAASVMSDRTAAFEKMMLDLASEFSDKYVKLDTQGKGLVDTYLREANYQGIAFDKTSLVAKGFTEDMIDTVKNWRKYWDSQFYLENFDLVRSLNAGGYLRYSDNNTQLFAKPISKNRNIATVYDPSTSSVRAITEDEIEELYNAGGTLARFRRTADFSGAKAEHMLVRNTPTEYLRTLRDTDRVLNYKEGYFQIQYDAPKFVEEIIRDIHGNETGRRAIAVAGDTAEANAFAQRMATNSGRPVEDYVVRSDVRAMRKDDDSYWDVTSASGRIAQRHRGKTLENASGLNHLGDGSYILNPVDSARRAAQSIAGRTVSRPMLDAAKERFIRQYSGALKPNQYGGYSWPKNIDEIDIPGKSTDKLVADARTTYEHINYLENGYINAMDDVYKNLITGLADVAGEKGLTKAERLLRQGGDVSLTGASKNLVFMSYIGAHPLRQWVVQPHQVIRTVAYNPSGWATGNVPRLVGEFYSSLLPGGKTTKEGQAFVKFANDSGMLDAIDKNNLVRGTLLDAANTTNKALRVAKAPLTGLRKLGFDAGEHANLVGHLSAVYDKYKRSGVDLSDKTIRDEAFAEARALGYSMNFAGDMPYNQTSAALIMQFAQVPHKAVLQMFDRRLPLGVRQRLFVTDTLLWGTPIAAIGSLLGEEVLPEDKDTRDMLMYGIEAWVMNEALTQMSGEKVDLDFSASLSPYNLSGLRDTFVTFLTEGPEASYLNSPSGQLLFKDGSRMQKAFQSVGRYFNAFDEVGQEKTEFLEMINEVGKIASGWNDAHKARILLDMRKRLDQYGNVTDEDVSKVEALAQLFGIGTSDTRDLYKISIELSEANKNYKEEVLTSYKDIKRYYTDKLGVEAADPRFVSAVSGFALKAYGDSPVAMKIIQNQLLLDVQGKESGMIHLFMKRAEIPDMDNMRDLVKRAPMDETKRANMNRLLDDLEATRKKYKKEEE